MNIGAVTWKGVKKLNECENFRVGKKLGFDSALGYVSAKPAQGTSDPSSCSEPPDLQGSLINAWILTFVYWEYYYFLSYSIVYNLKVKIKVNRQVFFVKL